MDNRYMRGRLSNISQSEIILLIEEIKRNKKLFIIGTSKHGFHGHVTMLKKAYNAASEYEGEERNISQLIELFNLKFTSTKWKTFNEDVLGLYAQNLKDLTIDEIRNGLDEEEEDERGERA